MGLRRADEFSRKGRRLPGQSSDSDLGLERSLTIKVTGQAAVINEELIQIGDVSKGNYIELGPEGIKIHNEGTELNLWAAVDGGQAQSELRINGVSYTDNEASIGLLATRYDGSGQCSLILDTAANIAALEANRFLIGASLVISPVTTSQRDALPQIPGTIVYNASAGKFQGYAVSSWVDLH